MGEEVKCMQWCRNRGGLRKLALLHYFLLEGYIVTSIPEMNDHVFSLCHV